MTSSLPSLVPLGEVRAIRSAPVLAASKRQYFVPLIDGFFLTVTQSGTDFHPKRHLANLYFAPAAIMVGEVLESKPILSSFTIPFLFHAKEDANKAIRSLLTSISEDYI